ncbi:MAG: ABC transporter ATP-binding protein [Planctomycetota bacterium]|jgi:phospholipid/cholesterol/gamma-HCH transport system ATP-binding protein
MSAKLDGQGIVRMVKATKWFDRAQVLRAITLEFTEGKTTVVLGPSGCGKTVLLKHIVGLLKPDRGEVWYRDKRIDTLSEAELGSVRRQFGYLFQHGALFDSMTVCENVAFPLLEHTRHSAAERQERAREVLAMVGMDQSIDKMPAELSGGQRKRVSLARAIVLEPKVMLYDEPTTGLDPIRADVINHLIIKLQKQLQITSIVVTHDLAAAFRVADIMVMLYDGAVVMQGTPRQLRESSDPIVRRFLAGEATAEELAGMTRDREGAQPGEGEDWQ